MGRYYFCTHAFCDIAFLFFIQCKIGDNIAQAEKHINEHYDNTSTSS